MSEENCDPISGIIGRNSSRPESIFPNRALHEDNHNLSTSDEDLFLRVAIFSFVFIQNVVAIVVHDVYSNVYVGFLVAVTITLITPI